MKAKDWKFIIFSVFFIFLSSSLILIARDAFLKARNGDIKRINTNTGGIFHIVDGKPIEVGNTAIISQIQLVSVKNPNGIVHEDGTKLEFDDPCPIGEGNQIKIVAKYSTHPQYSSLDQYLVQYIKKKDGDDCPNKTLFIVYDCDFTSVPQRKIDEKKRIEKILKETEAGK